MAEWVDLKEYEGFYKISSEGRVLRVGGKELKSFINGSGYLQLCLCKNGKQKSHRIHRLVAENFMPKPDKDGLEVNHIDGIKTNNKLSNLEWVNRSENLKHAINIGLFTPKKDSQHNRFKSPIQIYKGGFGYIVFGASQIRSFGFKTSSVYGCANGKQTWAGNKFKATRIEQLRKE